MVVFRSKSRVRLIIIGVRVTVTVVRGEVNSVTMLIKCKM